MTLLKMLALNKGVQLIVPELSRNAQFWNYSEEWDKTVRTHYTLSNTHKPNDTYL